MPTWIRGFVAGSVARLPTFLTLACLGGLALWGSLSGWNFSGRGDDAPEKNSSEETINAVADPTGPSGSMQIKFPSAAAVDRAGLRFAVVQVRPMALFVTAIGMVDYEPSHYAHLTARASGTIRRVEKEVGDSFKKGDLLALIEAAEVGQAKANFLTSLVQFRLRGKTLDRLESLFRQGATSEQTYYQADTALREAKIRLFNDQQALLNLGLPIRLKDVEKLSEDELVRHLRLLGLPEHIRKQVDPETLTANLLPLTAPFDGEVVQRFAAPGEMVQVSQPKILYIVADVTQLHIDLDVKPEDMAMVRLGQKLTFMPDGEQGGEARAHVTQISPEVDEKTRRVRVHAHVDNSKRRLRPNSYGTGRILVREQSQALVVPADAVQTDGDKRLVFVKMSDSSFQARPVQVSVRDGNLVAVTGVRDGEQVVTTGSFMLKSELLKDRISSGD